MSSSYRLELDRWLVDTEVKAETVFDVGGSQLPVKGRTKSWEVKDYKIIDLPEPHVGSPKPHIEFDLEKDNWGKDKPTSDLVFCLEVFDYIVLPDIALDNIKRMLKPGGVAYITFPFIYPTHQPLEAEGLRYTENAIKRLCQMAGLKIKWYVKRRPETDLLDQFYRAERMRAAKNYDHNFTGFIVKVER